MQQQYCNKNTKRIFDLDKEASNSFLRLVLRFFSSFYYFLFLLREKHIELEIYYSIIMIIIKKKTFIYFYFFIFDSHFFEIHNF